MTSRRASSTLSTMTITPRSGPRVPRNQFGQPATRTTDETIVRLMEKVSKNRGQANRARIQAQIQENRAIKVQTG